MITQLCKSCEMEMPMTPEYFWRRKDNPNGFDVTCKDCRNKQRREKFAEDVEHRNTVMERNRRWVADNPDIVRKIMREGMRRRYQNDPQNRERVKERTRQYIEQHREEVNEKKREYRKTEKYKQTQEAYCEKQRIARRAYKKRNPHKNIEDKQRRRTKEYALPMNYSVTDTKRALKHFNHCCPVCGTSIAQHSQRNLDHWIPICHETCPGTIRANIIPLCKFCNQSKGARLPLVWLLSKFDEDSAHEIFNRIENYLKAQDK